MRHDSFMHDTTHSRMTWPTHAWHDSFVCHWLIHTAHASLRCHPKSGAPVDFLCVFHPLLISNIQLHACLHPSFFFSAWLLDKDACICLLFCQTQNSPNTRKVHLCFLCIVCLHLWSFWCDLFFEKSPTVQRCDANLFMWDRHGTPHAPYVSSKEPYTAWKEAYSPEVSRELTCVRQAWHLTCARYVFQKAL